MDVKGKIIVVTGGASGIGAAMCRAFAQANAKMIVVADRNAGGARALAEEIQCGVAIPTDVSVEAEVRSLVEKTIETYDRIDLFCSNAGIAVAGGEEASNEDWQRIWEINVMAHVYASRAVIPVMLTQGGGYLLNTASAAGLLTQVDSASYSVTKHGAVAFAEWLAIKYGDRGIKVSCLCPQGVRTPMLEGTPGSKKREGMGGFLQEGSISAEEAASVVVAGLAAEKFLILPHPEVADYFARKANDYDRWLRGMRKKYNKPPEPISKQPGDAYV
jgi:NAD(P)-dependent dehydrogenase (short-subunit alcohol dehydrogenase family)